ncbi:hypothetical protein PPTG_22794 [Phytophthora nicotianae INRA-310]|uniref:BED-type domain-containing protein n=1 Tax=Phytophthora nicotianae (strain INRA-310) TaxID=761204 RepID=W2QAB3_PHYN3|nr:hypothetical protein PPTG_22794 [Phytophthora nicotianae INRA-310]ETN10107.1 hypothetical protein PPTG_22794 [Phytophthora nicotianae INRA-310]
MTSRQRCTYYYTDLGEGLFDCKTCGRHRNHLSSKHDDYATEYAELQASATPSIASFDFADDSTRNIYQSFSQNQYHM